MPRKGGFRAHGERLVRGRARMTERNLTHAAGGYRLFTTPACGDVVVGHKLSKIFRKFDLKMDKMPSALRTPYSRLSASVLLKAARQQTPSEMGQGHEILVQGRILADYRRSAVAVEREERIGTAGRRHRSGFGGQRSGVRHASVLHASAGCLRGGFASRGDTRSKGGSRRQDAARVPDRQGRPERDRIGHV